MESTGSDGVSETTGGKVALVIGNSLYGGGEEVSGVRDATDMKAYLEELGFTVLEPVLNGKLEDMRSALTRLGASIKKASFVIFFYSGHGFQVDGVNLLMPIGGSTEPSSSLPLDDVQQTMLRAPDEALKLIILDACRDQKILSSGMPRGFAEPVQPPRRIVFAFAASAGGTAESGSTTDSRSPYTTALLRHLREPGLEVRDLLTRVTADVTRDTNGQQRPITVALEEAKGFFLRPSVVVQAKISKADDDLFVLLHGEMALAASRQRERELDLKAEDNPFALLVANGKSFHNNHDWDLTEGWSYEMKLELPDGTEEVFQDDGESTPFKDGPHHGQVFVVAKANLFVDPETAKVTVKDKKKEVWRTETETPLYARDQEILYEKSVADLPIDLDEIVREALREQDPLLQIFVPIITQVLRSGQFLGHTIADPSRTFVLVLGNKAFKDLVDVCMNEHQADRIRDLKAGLSQVLVRTGRPFETFDRNLVACLQEEARRRGWTDPKPEEIFVWTAIDDRSRD